MKVYIFLTHNLQEGGIENGYFKIKKSLSKNSKCISLIRNGSYVSPLFHDVLKDCTTIYFDPTKINWTKNIDLPIQKQDEIVMFSANMIDVSYLSHIKRKYKDYNINLVYWIPHFTGKMVYFEYWFPNFLVKIIRRFLRNLYIQMDKNNSICYGNKTHYDAFIKNYKYKTRSSVDECIWSVKTKLNEIIKEDIKDKYKKKPFKIIAIGRFSFPHKGFILGLIDSFSKIHEEYHNTELIIVGDGPDKRLVEEKINSCSDSCKDNIHLTGSVSYSDLKEILNDCHLNIGLAGTITDGVKNGVLSIPVRNYCNECECYGFYYDAPGKNLSCEKGMEISHYIVEAINMTEEEFVNKTLLCYDTLRQINDKKKFDNTAENLFSIKNVNRNYTIPRIYELFFTLAAAFATKRVKNKNHTDLVNYEN